MIETVDAFRKEESDWRELLKNTVYAENSQREWWNTHREHPKRTPDWSHVSVIRSVGAESLHSGPIEFDVWCHNEIISDSWECTVLCVFMFVPLAIHRDTCGTDRWLRAANNSNRNSNNDDDVRRTTTRTTAAAEIPKPSSSGRDLQLDSRDSLLIFSWREWMSTKLGKRKINLKQSNSLVRTCKNLKQVSQLGRCLGNNSLMAEADEKWPGARKEIGIRLA